MILKAIFIESSLSPIQGLDKRTNPALAQQIEDYVNERFSAGRQCTYEIWRCLGPYAKGPIIKRISEIASHGNETERLAAALCLSVSPDPLAQLYLRQNKELKNIIDNDRITWNSL